MVKKKIKIIESEGVKFKDMEKMTFAVFKAKKMKKLTNLIF